MKPQYHATYSVLIAGILYLFCKSWSIALSCLISGVFIDLDHIYDYIREFGFPFKVKNFLHAVENHDISRVTLILHSWELLILIGIIAYFMNWNPWLTGTLIGFGHHLVLDKLNNGERIRAYSFMWRWENNFEFEKIFFNDAKKKNDRMLKYKRHV
jgi:hypothetical protein